MTGGAGFIGSNFIRYILGNDKDSCVLNFDKLTYAGNLDNLEGLDEIYRQRYQFVKGDICDKSKVKDVINESRPDYIINFAAESHVDRSIDGPEEFIQTNIVGTYVLLNTALQYFKELGKEKREKFRFLHISTDEVYGELGSTGKFDENSRYDPHSPYSASKASSDHLIRAWNRTFGLPTLITNCSNNYGPYQFPEKLIPLMIINAISGKKLPVYGKGDNIRDWIYVTDHCGGISAVLNKGRIGETYNIGGNTEVKNLQVVKYICNILDNIEPRNDGNSYQEQITFVKDRPGHDFRYAIDNSKIKNELGWEPKENFKTGIQKTVEWYLENQDWWGKLQEKYKQERLGKR